MTVIETETATPGAYPQLVRVRAHTLHADVTPTANGPLVVDGNLEICAGTGRTIHRVSATALCRCGHSANKPFCDGSHERVGFQAAGAPVSEP